MVGVSSESSFKKFLGARILKVGVLGDLQCAARAFREAVLR